LSKAAGNSEGELVATGLRVDGQRLLLEVVLVDAAEQLWFIMALFGRLDLHSRVVDLEVVL